MRRVRDMAAPVTSSTSKAVTSTGKAVTEHWIDVVDPATGRAIATVPAGTAADVDRGRGGQVHRG